MTNKMIPLAVLSTALVTSLAVTSYTYSNAVNHLEKEVQVLEAELEVARAQAVDTSALTEIFGATEKSEEIIPAAPDNWIFGSVSARYSLIELTDTECPYCRDHFPLVKALIESSAGQMNAALVHVPALGEASRRQAIAIECAGEQGGSDAAWKFTQAIFDKTGGNGKGVAEPLVSIATGFGLDGQRFGACMESSQAVRRVANDLDEAIKLGIQQTPSTLIVDNQTGKSIVLQGANASQEGILKGIATLHEAGVGQ